MNNPKSWLNISKAASGGEGGKGLVKGGEGDGNRRGEMKAGGTKGRRGREGNRTGKGVVG